MEILVHVSAPSSARDDARYRAQVAAISCAFDPVSVSRPLLISDDDQHYHRDGLALVPAGLLSPPPANADAPETAENAEPAEPADSDSSLLLLQVPELELELISAPTSVSISSLVVENASAAIDDQVNGARRTSSDSPCDWDLKILDQDLRRKNQLGNPLLPRAEEGCPDSNPAGNGNGTATTTATTISNPNPNPCPRRADHQSIPPSPNPGTNQSRPNPPVPAPRESECQIASINAQPQIAPDSLGSLISVIPDSQPDLPMPVSGYAQESCQSQSATRSVAQLHEEDDHDQPSRSPKRRRVEPCSPRPGPQTGQGHGQTIGKFAALEGTVPVTLPLDPAHHIEKALSKGSRDECESPPSPAPEAQDAYPHSHTHTHPNISPFPSHPPNPVSADSDPVVSVTETRPHPQEEQHQHHHHHHHHNPNTLLSTLPLSLRPAPPPISTSKFTTHITPTLSMLTRRLKPARTYKPTHQARELDKLERGYWSMRIDIVPKAATVPTHEQEKSYTKDSAGDIASPVPGPGQPQTWTEAQFTHFWTFLSDFIAKEARAGWGVWCIVDRVEGQPQPKPQLHPSKTHAHTDGSIVGETHIQVHLKVYAWGEVAMHIYLMLYLASERRVRRMGLRWVDSWEEVVIQMP